MLEKKKNSICDSEVVVKVLVEVEVGVEKKVDSDSKEEKKNVVGDYCNAVVDIFVFEFQDELSI